MKYFVFIFTILLFFNGCSSVEQSNSSKNAVNTAVSNSNPANTDTAASNVYQPQTVPYNGMEKVNPNAFNAANDNLKVINSEPKKDQLPMGTRTAPDDSIFYSTMNAKGQPMEIRVFKSHPVLAKVEKTFIGRDLKYKVFLKNGKTLDAPADKMSNFAALPPEAILEAVGMLPKPQTNPPPKTEEKKQ